MKKICVLFLLAVLGSVPLAAQNQGYMKETFNSELFPEVSFVWHDDGAEILSKKDVRFLKESGLSMDFSMDQQARNDLNAGKRVVILWEDFKEMSGGKDIRVGQHDFIKKTIGQFLASNKIGSNDEFVIADFNRSRNTTMVMQPLHSGFSGDLGMLGIVVESHQHSSIGFENAPNTSDLYSAVREALEMLQALPEGNESKAVYLFTAGHPRNVAGADSADQVLLLAQRYNIPVYIIEYASRSGVALEPANFAKATEGKFECFMQNEEDRACKVMLDWYDQIDDAFFGHDYLFSFTSNLKRGGDPQTIALNINGIEYQEQYMPPAFSLKEWIMEHLLLTILLILLLLALIILAIVLSVTSHKKKARKLKALEQQQQEAEAEAQQAIAQANSSLDAYKRQQEINRRADQERAELDRLAGLMKQKNVIPRLVCDVEGNKSSREITTPSFTIGREPDNDLQFNHPTVSRHHAKITYDGYGFYITDLGSSNHVVVNGTPQMKTVLRSGDSIQLGQAKIIFYL